MRRLVILLSFLAAGCSGLPVNDPAYQSFIAVAERVEPVAAAECKRRDPELDCDFQVRVDVTPDAPPNAFQTVDSAGRPLVIFTSAMVRSFRNPDEAAFVMSHEVSTR